ncbi:non-hydrolyzing UDP-N-acetylglucosamine 2-epimerase [Marinobacter salicampi]|uniref:non-hydrolyzing UDP-N-acetylglucosamine 2-epimerase n=1 Tax=Marinobacter salicampi TaxID=435907 RepID=UPI001409D25C|nr:UDP-N-acetylglucosamine 2-epimerase (non-hydrolyzing) [Marinobacter salicampi]
MHGSLTTIGAGPQFIKARVVTRAIQLTEGIEEILLHAGNHFDVNMSKFVFNQLGIPKPDIQLNIHGGSHDEVTGRILTEVAQALLEHTPDRVYGDTNSILADALASSKLHVPVAHVEASLRSYNKQMDEEVNLILTDQISALLVPTTTAVKNLEIECFRAKPIRVLQAGDVMQGAALLFTRNAFAPAYNQLTKDFLLATLHQAKNAFNPKRLANIIHALNEIHLNQILVVLPFHFPTMRLIAQQGLELDVHLIELLGFFEMVWLIDRCQLALTDSEGLQKEAFLFDKACVTMHCETEWVELIEVSANELVRADRQKIEKAAARNAGGSVKDRDQLYGGGQAAQRIVKEIEKANS